MKENIISRITLQPIDPELKKQVFEQSIDHMSFVVFSYIIFAFISLLGNIGDLIYASTQHEDTHPDLVRVLGDICRIVFYVCVIIIGRTYKRFQLYVAYFLPMIYTILISEVYILTIKDDFIIQRYFPYIIVLS